MTTLTRKLHVSELPRQLRQGREDGFVTLTVADAEAPSDTEKLAYLQREIAEGDRAIAEGRVSPAADVFGRLRDALVDHKLA
jgi:hypothetical protein